MQTKVKDWRLQSIQSIRTLHHKKYPFNPNHYCNVKYIKFAADDDSLENSFFICCMYICYRVSRVIKEVSSRYYTIEIRVI